MVIASYVDDEFQITDLSEKCVTTFSNIYFAGILEHVSLIFNLEIMSGVSDFQFRISYDCTEVLLNVCSI